MDNYIVGRNAVKEALKSGRSIQRILVSEDKVKTGLADIVNLAKSQGIEVRPTPVKQMNKYDLEVPHQGVIALWLLHLISMVFLSKVQRSSLKRSGQFAC